MARGDRLTWGKLAEVLGVSVAGLLLWRKRDGAPHNADEEAWREFALKEGLGVTGNRVGKDRETLLAEAVAKRNRLLDLEIAEREKRMVDRNEADALFLHTSALQKTLLYAALERELPAKAEGRTAAEIAVIGRDIADRLCDVFTTSIESWRSV